VTSPAVRTAIVTAASRGLGKAIAMQLARDGIQVGMCSSRADAIEEAAREVQAATRGRVIGFCVDLGSGEDVAALVDKVSASLASPDILVYNSPPPRAMPFSKLEEPEWRKAFEQVLMSAVTLVKGVLPRMREQRWGRLIFLGSSATNRPIADLCLSNVYRSSLVGLARSLVTDVGAGVTVNSVLPGNVLTQRMETIFHARARASGKTYEEYLQAQSHLSPVGRLGQATEVADLVAFLASERAGFIHGAMIPIDGGHSELPPLGS